MESRPNYSRENSEELSDLKEGLAPLESFESELRLQDFLLKKTEEFRCNLFAELDKIDFGELSDQEISQIRKETGVFRKLRELVSRMGEAISGLGGLSREEFLRAHEKIDSAHESRESLYKRSDEVYKKVQESGLDNVTKEDLDFIVEGGGASFMFDFIDQVPESVREHLLVLLAHNGYHRDLFNKFKEKGIPRRVVYAFPEDFLLEKEVIDSLDPYCRDEVIYRLDQKYLRRFDSAPERYVLIHREQQAETDRQRAVELKRKRAEKESNDLGIDKKESLSEDDPYIVSRTTRDLVDNIADTALGREHSLLKDVLSLKLDPFNKVSRLRKILKSRT